MTTQYFAKQYSLAVEKAKYNVGDIIGDKFDRIRVEEIGAREKVGKFHVYYRGPLVTQKGDLCKRGGIRVIQESEVTFIKKKALCKICYFPKFSCLFTKKGTLSGS